MNFSSFLETVGTNQQNEPARHHRLIKLMCCCHVSAPMKIKIENTRREKVKLKRWL